MSVGVLLLVFGCATMPPESVTPSIRVEEPRATIPSQEPTGRPQEPAPRTIAALRLTEQAGVLIASQKPDEAIRLLEKALNIDPNNGQNYYYLAEAWIIKGNKTQAIEFNRLAGIYLIEDAVWMQKVQQQKERIENIYEKR